MTDSSEFHYVHRAGRSKKRRGKNASGPIPLSDSLRSTREGLVSSGWWDSYRASRRQTELDAREVESRCLCLGLGSPTKSAESRAQLCVLLDLCAELAIIDTKIEVFDPAFEERDILELRGLGLRVLDENKKGAHVIDTPTLVYMPHCGIGLYERFLRANWSDEGMNRIILVANDMAAYVERRSYRAILVTRAQGTSPQKGNANPKHPATSSHSPPFALDSLLTCPNG
ncbi:SRR1-like protein OS=Mus musculus GN=Srrd PE=2 SV=4 [Rhizoctonia solani AG-1 IB]|uniref:SRR1-like protein n=1 Tax=Thanatephorus cucumeris (strain AG1-IB / isolate 7/3/14) TaxID=1108050 RepID=A0A0B7F6S7_THACB|nr:SRR1-like protein OS=Mus musculus GN=Srrd PE=2 SV=4 [Rhizoctonia solani AG-1 IB]